MTSSITPTLSLQAIGLGMTKTVANSKIVKIDQMGFSKITAGCLVVGYILEIKESKLIVSLPGGLTGAVAYSEVSDVLTKMVQERGYISKVGT